MSINTVIHEEVEHPTLSLLGSNMNGIKPFPFANDGIVHMFEVVGSQENPELCVVPPFPVILVASRSSHRFQSSSDSRGLRSSA